MSKERVQQYLERHTKCLSLLEAMWADPLVQCYNDAEKPSKRDEQRRGSVFLGGPTSRHQFISCNWRGAAVAYLREAGFRGYIYIPEPRGEEISTDFTERSYIHNWESDRLLYATHQVFWIPRKADELLGLNTNLELGICIGKMLFAKGKSSLFIGWPPEAERMGLPNHYAVELCGCHRYTNLKDLCYAVAGKAMQKAA